MTPISPQTQEVLDLLESNVAVLGSDGKILAVNASWCSFGRQNGWESPGDAVGTNYLEVGYASGDVIAQTMCDGIRSVISDTTPSFQFEYPCHTTKDAQRFRLRVLKMPGHPGHVILFHEDISLYVPIRSEHSGQSEDKSSPLRDQRDLIRSFVRVAEKHLNTLSRSEILDSLAAEFQNLGQFTGLTIWLVDEDRLEIARAATFGVQGSRAVEGSVSASLRFESNPEHPAVRVANTGQSEMVQEGNGPQGGISGSPKNGFTSFIPVKSGKGIKVVVEAHSEGNPAGHTLKGIRQIEPLLSQFAMALHHADSYEALARSTEHLKRNADLVNLFSEMGHRIRAGANSLEVFPAISRQIVASGGFRSAVISRVNLEDQTVRMEADEYLDPRTGKWVTNQTVGRTIHLQGKDIAAQTARTGQMQVVESAADPRLRGDDFIIN